MEAYCGGWIEEAVDASLLFYMRVGSLDTYRFGRIFFYFLAYFFPYGVHLHLFPAQLTFPFFITHLSIIDIDIDASPINSPR